MWHIDYRQGATYLLLYKCSERLLTHIEDILMLTNQEPMNIIKIKISHHKSPFDQRWSHKVMETTPRLRYEFGEKQYWTANDHRVSDRSAVFDYGQNYWQQKTTDPSENKYHYIGKRRIPNESFETTNLVLYQRELVREITMAIKKVKDRWKTKFKNDFENHFQDDLVKFVNSTRK